MKTKLFAFVAVVCFAFAAPSFAHTGHVPAGTKTPPVKKQLVVKPKKIQMLAKLTCPKPVIVKGVKQCPPQKDAPAAK